MLYNPAWEIETTIAKDPWRRALWEAASFLREHGFCQGRFENHATGARCALGAIHAIVIERPGYGGEYWTEAVCKLRQRIGGPIAEWNDSNTAETVIATLESVALS